MTTVTNETQLQTALTAGEVAVFGPGTFNISNTVTISSKVGGGIRGEGPGLLFHNPAAGGSRTVLRWTGAAGGTMFRADGWGGGQIRDIAFDGSPDGVAVTGGVGFQFSDSANFGSAELLLENVVFRNFTVACISIGELGQNNCSDIMYRNVHMGNCPLGLITNNEQSVNHTWIGGSAGLLGTVWWIARGGNFNAFGAIHVHGFNWLLDVFSGGPNAYQFKLDGLRLEMSGYTKRFARIVKAQPVDICHVVLDNFQMTDFVDNGLTDNRAESLVLLGPGGYVDIRNFKHRISTLGGVEVRRKIVEAITGGTCRMDESFWEINPATKTNWDISTGSLIMPTSEYKILTRK